MDLRDDKRIGVGSTAVLFGAWRRSILGMFCIGFLSSLIWAGIKGEYGFGYFGISVVSMGAFLGWQLATWDQNNPMSCFSRFDMNGRWGGLIVASGLAIDYLLQVL